MPSLNARAATPARPPAARCIQFDFEFSLRLWKLGYRAGVMDFQMGYQASGQDSGTRANPGMYHKRKSIDSRNQAFYARQYRGFYVVQGDWHTQKGTRNPTGVQKLATESNRELLRDLRFGVAPSSTFG